MGPLVHLADPFSDSAIAETIAAALAPRYRVVSLSPRASIPYQLAAWDLLGTLDQFGFTSPILVGQRLACLSVLIVAAWYPSRVGGLVLIDPNVGVPPGDSIEARALRGCPPDWPALRAAVACPMCELDGGSAALTEEIDAFATAIR